MTRTDLARVGAKWQAAKTKERALAAELYEAIREAVEGGMTEAEAARVAGVDRMTVRRALGKR
jgi:DNA invertase Pin-like site-specific DNA recombinase